MATKGDVPVASLKGVFDAKFEEELQQLDPAKRQERIAERLQSEWAGEFDEIGNLRDTEEKRRAIARLLFSAVELSLDGKAEPGQPPPTLFNDPAYRRALAVVGVETAQQEMSTQARDLVQIAQSIRGGMARDREQFVHQYAAQLARILDAADELNDLQAELQNEKEKVALQQSVISVRQKDVADVQERLGEKQKQTRKLLDQQKELELELSKALLELRDAASKNLQLEQEVRTLEKGR
jgi:hypothetical protein